MNDKVVGFASLYEAHLRAQQGVIWKDSVAFYSLNAIEQTIKLSNQLMNNTYEPRPTISFKIYYPKERDILSIAYRDRVYQRSLNDNILYPIMTKSLIHENGACQKGKGVDWNRNILRKQLRNYYINHGADGYVLQIDIHKYYPSMPHDLVKEMFKKKLDKENYERVEKILDGQYFGDKGYNPGSQMIQIAGISYPSGKDHYAKEKLYIKNYNKYMDDTLIISNDKEKLLIWLELLKIEYSNLGLELNPKKTRIYKISDGIEYLGYIWKLTDSGKVLQFPIPKKIKNMKQKINKLFKLYLKDERTLEAIDDSFKSHMAGYKTSNSYMLENKLNKWYKEKRKYYVFEKNKLISKGSKRT